MRELALMPKFKKALPKFGQRDAQLQKRIEETLIQMQRDVLAANLGVHKLVGKLQGKAREILQVGDLPEPPVGEGEVVGVTSSLRLANEGARPDHRSELDLLTP